MTAVAPVRRWWAAHREFGRFAVIGAANVGFDAALFNLVHAAGAGPVTAKAVSTTAATVVSFALNRSWAFAGRRHDAPGRQAARFGAVNGVAIAVVLGVVACARYLFGFTGLVALNVAANGVGTAVGMVVRLAGYRRFVFTGAPVEDGEGRGRSSGNGTEAH